MVSGEFVVSRVCIHNEYALIRFMFTYSVNCNESNKIGMPVHLLFLLSTHCCCCLPTPMTLNNGGEFDLPDCGPPTIFSVHLASSVVTPAGSVHKSRGDNVLRMWV